MVFFFNDINYQYNNLESTKSSRKYIMIKKPGRANGFDMARTTQI